MKLLSTILLAFVLFTNVEAQLVTKKQISTKGSYGEKKLKKAPKKIYIQKFAVFFEVSKEGEASSKGSSFGGNSFSSTYTKMAIAIDGVDSDDFVAIADKAYSDYVEGLKKLGYEIVEVEQAEKTEYCKGWTKREGGNISYAQANGLVMATPTGYKYLVNSVSKSGKEKKSFFGESSVAKLSKQLDDAVVVSVSFVFPSIKMKTKGGTYSFGSSVKAYPDFKMGVSFQDGSAFGSPVFTKIVYTQGKSFGMSANTVIKTVLKKDIELEGVFADEKFKSVTISKGSAVPDYYTVVFPESKTTAVTHKAIANHDKYLEQVNLAVSDMITYDFNKLKKALGK